MNLPDDNWPVCQRCGRKLNLITGDDVVKPYYGCCNCEQQPFEEID